MINKNNNVDMFIFSFLAFFFIFSTLTVTAFAESEIILHPTDDAYVVTDLNDLEDTQGLNKLNTGDAEFLKIWYGWDVTEHNNRIFSPTFLKFDVSQIQDSEIDSAILKLYFEDGSLVSTSRILATYLVDDSNWNEDEITYESAPEFKEIFVPYTITTPGWNELDITPLILENTGNELSIAILFANMEPNNEELLIVSSKESQNSEQIPSLIITKQQKFSHSEIVYPSDDAFVVSDLSDPNDIQLLQQLNTGDLDFLKLWSVNDATPDHELINTNAYLKFDFSEIEKNQIGKVTLNLKPSTVIKNTDNLSLILGQASSESWDETTLTYSTAPTFSSDLVYSIALTDPEIWHTWDITDLVQQNNDSEMTFVIGLNELSANSEELVEFYSKESLNNSPFVEIQYVSVEGGGCLIATAAYGSELAPQVQLLREIRDNQLMNTDSGTSFMAGFNQFYYSFSPVIADYERENPVFKEMVKIGITPLLSSLSIMKYADSESDVLGYGIGVILMNMGMYFVAPVLGLMLIQKISKSMRCDNL